MADRGTIFGPSITPSAAVVGTWTPLVSNANWGHTVVKADMPTTSSTPTSSVPTTGQIWPRGSKA